MRRARQRSIDDFLDALETQHEFGKFLFFQIIAEGAVVALVSGFFEISFGLTEPSHGSDPNGWTFITEPVWLSGEAVSFYTPVIMDPKVPGTLFYVTGGIAFTNLQGNFAFSDIFTATESATFTSTKLGWTIGMEGKDLWNEAWGKRGG